MGEMVIKSGPMIKRSQNKKKWSMVNYKHRWFELSRSFLIYYDNCEGGREVSFIIFLLFCIYTVYFFMFTCVYIIVWWFLFTWIISLEDFISLLKHISSSHVSHVHTSYQIMFMIASILPEAFHVRINAARNRRIVYIHILLGNPFGKKFSLLPCSKYFTLSFCSSW